MTDKKGLSESRLRSKKAWNINKMYCIYKVNNLIIVCRYYSI